MAQDLSNQLFSQFTWTSSMTSTLILVLVGGAFVIIVAALIFAYFKRTWIFTEYPLNIINKVLRGKDFIVEGVDKARVVKTTQGELLYLKKAKIYLKPASYQNFLKGSWTEYYWVSRDEAHPAYLEFFPGRVAVYDEEAKKWVKKTNGVVGVHVLDEDFKLAYTSSFREMWNRFTMQGWFEKNFWIFQLIILGVMLLVMLYLYAQTTTPNTQAWQSIAQSTNQSAESWKVIAQYLVQHLNASGSVASGVPSGLSPP